MKTCTLTRVPAPGWRRREGPDAGECVIQLLGHRPHLRHAAGETDLPAVKPLTLCVSDFDRAAPHGTGSIKAGLNYAMSLHAIVGAHKAGFDENMYLRAQVESCPAAIGRHIGGIGPHHTGHCVHKAFPGKHRHLQPPGGGFDENMYLDPGTRTRVEETGGANFLFVTKDGGVVTPKSDSILPSITRRSLLHVAKEYLGLEVSEREVYLDELARAPRESTTHSSRTAALFLQLFLIRSHGSSLPAPGSCPSGCR